MGGTATAATPAGLSKPGRGYTAPASLIEVTGAVCVWGRPAMAQDRYLGGRLPRTGKTGGINSGMKSYPRSDEILADLGDKVLNAFSLSVAEARVDLLKYRRENPLWVAEATERGLANWIHDRLWQHARINLDFPDVSFRDEEPRREFWVGTRYRFRLKRHHDNGRLSTYPTDAALDFYIQPDELPGLEELRLTVGYDWLRDERDIGPAVITLRDGLDQVIWIEQLPPPATGRVVEHPASPVDGPVAPSIDVVVEGGDEAAPGAALA